MIYSNVKRFLVAIFLFVNGSALNSFAQQPGELDVSFGVDGITLLGELNRHDESRGLIIKENGKIAVTGKVAGTSGQDNDVEIAQLLSNGILDVAFGVDGIVVNDLGGTLDIGLDLLLNDANDLIIAASVNASGSVQSAFLSYNELGELNNGFGLGGELVFDLGLSGNGVVSVSPLIDNVFYGLGFADEKLSIGRFFEDGTFDSSFGIGGVGSLDIGDIDAGVRLKVRNDGKIVFSARTEQLGEFPDAVVGVLNVDGSANLDFNGTGFLNLSLSDNIDIATDLALLPDNKILVIGTVFDSNTLVSSIFAVKLKGDGAFDNTFGSGGIAFYDLGSGNDAASKLVVQPDGKAIIGGTTNDGNDNNFCLLRINEDGSLDPAFGDNGIVITEVSPNNDGISDIELQADGKLVVAGTARIGTKDDIAVARYHTGLNISVNEVENGATLKVFPNPSTSQVTLTSKGVLSNIELIDALGRVVLTQMININRSQLDLTQVPNGIYLLRASNEEGLFTQRVVKE